MFYTKTVTLTRLIEIQQQIDNGNQTIDMCGQEFSILLHMSLPTRNTKKKLAALKLREYFNNNLSRK